MNDVVADSSNWKQYDLNIVLRTLYLILSHIKSIFEFYLKCYQGATELTLSSYYIPHLRVVYGIDVTLFG